MGSLAMVPSDVLRQMPAGATAVDAIPSNGGWLVLGSDGGVFALGGAQLAFNGGDATGAFSYPGLPAADRQGTRTFKTIEVNGQGGYDLVSTTGEHYSFAAPESKADPTATPATSTIVPGATAPTATDNTWSTVLHSILDPIGLGSLADDTSPTGPKSWYVNGQGNTDYILQQLHQSPAYTTAFPEMAARQKAGLPSITEADILNYRATAKQLVAQAGLPPDTITDQEITNFIEGDVSPVEISDRISKGLVAALQAPPEFRAALATLGVGTGQLAQFYLDPTKAYDTITQQAAIGESALQQGYGSLSADEMTALQGAGLTQSQAMNAFGNLYQQRQLSNPLPGQQGTGIDRATQMQYAEGLAPAQEQYQKAGEANKAEFAGGGSVQTGSTGATGAGVSE